MYVKEVNGVTAFVHLSTTDLPYCIFHTRIDYTLLALPTKIVVCAQRHQFIIYEKKKKKRRVEWIHFSLESAFHSRHGIDLSATNK